MIGQKWQHVRLAYQAIASSSILKILVGMWLGPAVTQYAHPTISMPTSQTEVGGWCFRRIVDSYISSHVSHLSLHFSFHFCKCLKRLVHCNDRWEIAFGGIQSSVDYQFALGDSKNDTKDPMPPRVQFERRSK